jgi:opacity protein-like surface antigen
MRCRQVAAWALWMALALPAVAWGQEWPELSEEAPEQGGGELDAALVIGIEDYVFAPDIPGATQNANDWYLYLTRTRKVPFGNVFFLQNQEGTREAMLEKAQEAAGRVGQGGTLWLVYVGHGAPGKDGKDGILVGSDAQQSATSLYARSVSQRELLGVMKGGAQARTVAVVDACFSGKGSAGDALVAGLQPLLPVTEQVEGATIMTAGASDQFAGPLPGAARPAFSYLALGALRGWGDQNRDGNVTPREATEYSRDALRVLLRDRSQTPAVSGPDQDAALALGATEEGPDLGELMLAMSKAKAIEPGGGGAKGGGPVVRDKGGPLSGVAPWPGFARVSVGVSVLDPSALSLTTLGTEINADSFFTNFDLDLKDARESINPLGVNLQLSAGQDGFILGALAGIAWANDLNVGATVSTKDDGFADEVPELVAGLDATITSYLRVDLGATAGYRIELGDFSVYSLFGLGVGFGFIDFNFMIDNRENEVSATQFNFLLPLQAGVDYDLTDSAFVHFDYAYFISPSQTYTVQGGLGMYY